MGIGISLVLGILTPTTRPERTYNSILRHTVALLGGGLALAWIMFYFAR